MKSLQISQFHHVGLLRPIYRRTKAVFSNQSPVRSSIASLCCQSSENLVESALMKSNMVMSAVSLRTSVAQWDRVASCSLSRPTPRMLTNFTGKPIS